MTLDNVDMTPYFTDIQLWIKDEEAFMKELTELHALVESSNDTAPFNSLWTFMSVLTDRLFTRLTSRAVLVCKPGFGSEHGGENRDEIMNTYQHYVRSTFVTDAMYGEVFMIVHCHAPSAMESIQYLETAESLLKGKLERWNVGEHHDFLYGLIFIGGKIAVYYTDKATKTFCRLLDGNLESANSSPKPGNWRPIVDVEVLKSLLGIFRKEWYRLGEREFRAAVACRKLGRMPLRGLAYEGELDKMMQEQLTEADRCQLENALKECGIGLGPTAIVPLFNRVL